MFTQVLDTLLAVVFPSHGDHFTLFPSLLYPVCLLGFSSFNVRRTSFPSFLLSSP
jgi:hypothetical protein